MCLAWASVVFAAEPKAAKVYNDGRRAELSGDIVRAYLLYSEAAALDPDNMMYWARSQTLRTQAAMKAKVMPKRAEINSASPAPGAGADAPAAAAGPGFTTNISEADLAEVRRLRPPPQLKPPPDRKPLNLRGTARTVMEQTAKAFGLQTVFDADYPAGPPVRLKLDDADYRQALHAAEAATGSFVFPLGERLIMVVKDTPQKRIENEPTVAVTIEIPEAVSVQDAQEVARAVQQTMEILKMGVDPNRRLVLIKDRVSKVGPAEALFRQLSFSRAEVLVEMQFVEVDRANSLSYGLLLPSQFPITYVGRGGVAGAAQSLARIFLGHTVLGLGIADARVFATMNESYSRLLLQSIVRAADGTAATFHVGDKFPIQTGGYLGDTKGFAASFNFEDLGVVLKVTPQVHGNQEVSLEVNAEFKALSGQALNGVPVISTRKLESKVRVRSGEWAVIGGLLTTNEADAITGTPGLSQLPVIGRLLRKNDRSDSDTEVLILMKPVLTNPPPDDSLTRTLWVGTAGRLDIPL